MDFPASIEGVAPTFTVPVTDPVLIFALAMAVFLVAPLVFERLRIPGLIGVIVAGIVVGPHALNLLERGPTIVLLGTVGLIYLMFEAGVDIDLHGFRLSRARSLTFGALTFAVPFAAGLVAARLLNYAPVSAVLLGAVFATQTLVSYPIAFRYRIVRSRAVTVTVGATIITDLAVLLVLAVAADAAQGALHPVIWLRPILLLGIVAAVVLVGLPRLARWYFRREAPTGAGPFLFVMATLFGGAFMSELAGVEPIIGAFLVGLGLNPLIPSAGLLASRIRFVGEAVFIPFFLLSVGMLVDLRVFLGSWETWRVMGALLLVAIATKWLAASVARRIFGYSTAEGWVMFGLSVTHAAAAIAVTLVGYELGLFDERILNAVVLVILVSCIIGPWVVSRHGRQLALQEEQRPFETSTAPRRLLVALSNPRTAPSLMELALLMRDPGTSEPLYALTVVAVEAGPADAQVANAERLLSHAAADATGVGVPVVPLTRLEHNFANGISRCALETRTSTLLVGWDGRTSRRAVFGSVLDQLLEGSPHQVVVAHLVRPLATARRVWVLVPRAADRAVGYLDAVRTVKNLVGRLGVELRLIIVADEEPRHEAHFSATRPVVRITAQRTADWRRALDVVRRETQRYDLVVAFGARRNTVAWDPFMLRLPSRLAALEAESFVLVHPAERLDQPTRPSSGVTLRGAIDVTRVVRDLSYRSAYRALDDVLQRQFGADEGRRRDILRRLLHGGTGAALELTTGAALFHARLSFLEEPLLFLGRSAHGLRVPGLKQPVWLVFLLLSPLDQPTEHLTVLGQVARSMTQTGLVDRLRKATSGEAMLRILERAKDG